MKTRETRFVKPASALVWMRRDLRCDDNAALYHARAPLRTGVLRIRVRHGILDVLPSRTDRALRSSMQACWRWTMGCANLPRVAVRLVAA